jgi:hypothetical protein
MVEHAGGVEEHLENDHGDGRNSKKSDRPHFYTHGEKDLYGVETDSCGDIEIKICMVNAMEAPKNWDKVKHGMLKVDDEIEKKNTQDDSHPFRQWNVIQYPPSTGFDIKSYAHGLKRDQETQGKSVDSH